MRKTAVISLCLGFLLMLTSCSSADAGGLKLDLDRLKSSEDMFCLENLTWKDTPEKVQEVLGIELGEPNTFDMEKDGVLMYESSLYYPEAEIKLMNMLGKSEFEFFDDKLAGILFHFEDEKETMEPFGEKILKKLSKLYSEEYEVKKPNASAQTKRTTYAWELTSKGSEAKTFLHLITTEKQSFYTVDIGLIGSNISLSE